MDHMSLILSIGSGIIAIISLYFSRFKLGNLRVLPLKIYVAQPLNFDGGRMVKVVAPVTFLNTGAVSRAVNDLRIRVEVAGKNDLILDWIYEYKEVSLLQEIGIGNFPAQPNIRAYESTNRIYGFQSREEGADSVSAMEKHEEAKTYPAFLEYNDEKGKWRKLNKFNFEYNGRRKWETNYSKINA